MTHPKLKTYIIRATVDGKAQSVSILAESTIEAIRTAESQGLIVESVVEDKLTEDSSSENPNSAAEAPSRAPRRLPTLPPSAKPWLWGLVAGVFFATVFFGIIVKSSRDDAIVITTASEIETELLISPETWQSRMGLSAFAALPIALCVSLAIRQGKGSFRVAIITFASLYLVQLIPSVFRIVDGEPRYTTVSLIAFSGLHQFLWLASAVLTWRSHKAAMIGRKLSAGALSITASCTIGLLILGVFAFLEGTKASPELLRSSWIHLAWIAPVCLLPLLMWRVDRQLSNGPWDKQTLKLLMTICTCYLVVVLFSALLLGIANASRGRPWGEVLAAAAIVVLALLVAFLPALILLRWVVSRNDLRRSALCDICTAPREVAGPCSTCGSSTRSSYSTEGVTSAR